MRLRRAVISLIPLVALAVSGIGTAVSAPTTSLNDVPASAAVTAQARGGQAYTEPVVLTAASGVLEIVLSAAQGNATIDTAAGTVRNAMLFGYRVIRGNASNGVLSAKELYPGPTLNVFPGQTLIVHMENALDDLTIKDFVDPAFAPKGDPVPLYPAQMASSPFNLHTHGLHVSPAGNGDNVLLNIPPGLTNTYTYAIPTDHPEGLYWYHSHRHMLTTPQTYRGLAGMIVIGRADGNIPAVAQHKLPVRTMALQYNYVFERAAGLATLNYPWWPAMLSTLKPPTPGSLADGSYEPKSTPINFRDSGLGTKYFTTWYTGPLSINNARGVFQYLPSNLQSFTSDDGRTVIPANTSLPEDQRDLQYTVNGQFQPVISAAPGQTEIWVLGNFTEAGYLRVALTETATGKRTKLAIVGIDGNPLTQVQPAFVEDGTVLTIPPASRYAIAVTMPQVGGLQLEMPTYTGKTPKITSNAGILYTNNKTAKSPAVTGMITVDPANISYADGFFVYPTQTLLRMQPTAGVGTTIPFVAGQPTNAYTSFVDLADVKPDVKRKLLISGGFTNNLSNDEDPNAFTYELDGNQFPNIPLLQPRLNTTEQWTFINKNNDEHPIHIHVNDFQVVDYNDPTNKIHLTNFPWGQDNQNVPTPLYGKTKDTSDALLAPGRMSLRTEFQDFIGTYVIHCHRLNHEDNGLMAIINVIPETTGYAVAVPGQGDRATRVTVYDQATRKVLASVLPFGTFTGKVDVAMGDINGDMILDLIAGGGQGSQPRVKVFSGAPNPAGDTFSTVLVNRLAFDKSFRGGVSVAAANINGLGGGHSIVVGSGPGMKATVKVFASGPTQSGVFSSWHPYGRFTGGVDVATGMVSDVGRESVVTAPGAGTQPLVKSWVFELFTRNGSTDWLPRHQHPVKSSSFLAFEESYRGGVSIATGWVAGELGGFSRIIAGKKLGSSTVSVFSSGSALTGHPEMYLMPANHYMQMSTFEKAAEFEAFPGSTSGVDVTSAANTHSADLVVSGVVGGVATVQRFDLIRKEKKDTMLTAVALSQTQSRAPIGAVGGS